jgi:hypothetical protein
LAEFRVDLDVAAVLADDFVGDEQTEAGSAAAFGRVEEGEQFFPGVSVHARAIVGHFKNDVGLIFVDTEADFVLGFAIVAGAGIDGILKDIDQSRVNVPRIDLDGPGIMVKLAVKFDFLTGNFG